MSYLARTGAAGAAGAGFGLAAGGGLGAAAGAATGEYGRDKERVNWINKSAIKKKA